MLHLLAQLAPVVTTAPATPQADVPWWAKLFTGGNGILLPAAAFLVFFYFVSIRGKQKEAKERQNLLNNIKKGDSIETIGGLIGTVVSADDKSVLLKVDETANVKMRFNRRAVHRVITDDADEAKK